MGKKSKSVWRKGEAAPEHVVDRAVIDIASERRAVTNDVLNLGEGKMKLTPTAIAMRASNMPASEMGKEGPEPVSGSHLSRSKQFKNIAMNYIYKLEHEGDNG